MPAGIPNLLAHASAKSLQNEGTFHSLRLY